MQVQGLSESQHVASHLCDSLFKSGALELAWYIVIIITTRVLQLMTIMLLYFINDSDAITYSKRIVFRSFFAYCTADIPAI